MQAPIFRYIFSKPLGITLANFLFNNSYKEFIKLPTKAAKMPAKRKKSKATKNTKSYKKYI